MKNTLSIYGSHDAAAVFVNNADELVILEYERFVKKRYAALTNKMKNRDGLGTSDEQRRNFFEYVKKKISREITLIIYNELDEKDIALLKILFPTSTFEKSEHHKAHAACGYYQSNFDDALIFSLDGGGLDFDEITTTKCFLADGTDIKNLKKHEINLGVAYGHIGFPISEINPGPDSKEHSLAYAGKVMGLCAYGKVREDWVPAFLQYYLKDHNLNTLGSNIKLNLNFNSLSGQNSYDLAATSQFVFEYLAFSIIIPEVEKYNKNVVLVGGCALNVLFNQKLAKYLKNKNLNLFVPPNPNDCGLALGQFLLKHPKKIQNITYNGLEILDLDALDDYVYKRKAEKITVSKLVSLLKLGSLIGILQGNSEVGPRALGNRSIICLPSFPGIKDTLNKKVKFREWYRPFAPVSRLEDANKYFEDVFESPCMTYAPKVISTYKKELEAITHVDDTARLQTVKKNQHQFFYDILTELDHQGNVPVILNTSFNIKGNPILTSIEDALFVLDNTELDYVLIEGYLFKSKKS